MGFLLVRHRVQDFRRWKAGYDAHLPKRAEAGLTEKYLLRDADDASQVVLLFEAQDLDRARAFAASADLRQKMDELGVIDRPDIYFLDE